MPQIRSATIEDVPAIRRIARESWHAAYDDILGPETVESLLEEWYARSTLEESVHRAATREPGAFLVADTVADDTTCEDGTTTEGGTTAEDKTTVENETTWPETTEEIAEETRPTTATGFAQGSPAQHAQETRQGSTTTAELVRIYVDPGSWSAGVGSALLERLERELDDSFERLRLNVLAGNAVGVSFYESRGFERVETHESELEEMVDAEDAIDEPLEEHVYEKTL